MATIERRPLPPPNSRVTTITEADRAEMMAQANAVIDYYLNGPGSYWDAGPRKPLVGDDDEDNPFKDTEDNTFNDLKKFKKRVDASKQFADDPNSVLDSVIGLIDRTMQQIKAVAQNKEGSDEIQRPLPSTNDRIDVRPLQPNAPTVNGDLPARKVPILATPPSSFNDRFGSWTSPRVAVRPDPYQSAPSPQSGSSAQADPRNIRVLARFRPDGTRILP